MQFRNFIILTICVICLVSGNPTAYTPEQVQKGIETARNILRAVGKRSGGDVQHDSVDDLCGAAGLALLACAEVPVCSAAGLSCAAKGTSNAVTGVVNWFANLFG